MYKIAILTTEYLQEFFKKALFKESEKYTIDFLIHDNLMQACSNYHKNEDKYDGFLTSGEIVTTSIEKYVGKFKKPVLSISSDLISYYETFFKLIYKTNNVNFDRVYIDFLDWSSANKNIVDYLSTGTYGDLLYGFKNSIRKKSLADIIDMNDEITEKHVKLWKEGKTDLSITRSSNIIPILEKEGVNYLFVGPDKFYAQESFQRLINKIEIQKLQQNSSAAIYLKVEKSSDIKKILKVIDKYKEETLTNFFVSHDETNIEIIATSKEIYALTNDLTECPLSKYIYDESKYEISIGYGLSKTTYNAIKNAMIAFQEAQNCSTASSFVLNDEGNLIGPLNSSKLKLINNKVTPFIKRVAKKGGLSTLTIQKIISIKQKLDKNEITATELSDYMGISTRNASRILLKLLEADEVVILYTQQVTTKGRPQKVFSILLEDPEQ